MSFGGSSFRLNIYRSNGNNIKCIYYYYYLEIRYYHKNIILTTINTDDARNIVTTAAVGKIIKKTSKYTFIIYK